MVRARERQRAADAESHRLPAKRVDLSVEVHAQSRARLDLTGSRISSQVDLTGKTLKNINVYARPHRFTGEKEYDGMYGVCARRDAKWDSPIRFETIRDPEVIGTNPHLSAPIGGYPGICFFRHVLLLGDQGKSRPRHEVAIVSTYMENVPFLN